MHIIRVKPIQSPESRKVPSTTLPIKARIELRISKVRDSEYSSSSDDCMILVCSSPEYVSLRGGDEAGSRGAGADTTTENTMV